MPQRRKHPCLIALAIETSTNYGREVLRGIQRFIKENTGPKWVAVLEQRELESTNPEWIEEWSGDGVISRSTTAELRRALQTKGIPIVDITDRHDQSEGSSIRSDDVAIGRIGAEHLMNCMLQNFAFCGFTNEAWSTRRSIGFRDTLAEHGINSNHLDTNWRSKNARDWRRDKSRLIKWLRGLPKPVGIMACNDARGKQLVDCCFQAGISVPEQVAIVGVDNDELLCDLCHTPLTSVIPNAEEVGYQSALRLEKMLKQQHRPFDKFTLAIPPQGIAVRRSSSIVAVDDLDMALALKLIRDHACSGISVSEVVSQVEMSRSSLERKFRTLIGRTPQQEIRRVQLDRVCILLSTTKMSVDEIATHCGFEHPEYFYVVFKREFQMTPGDFRIESRRGQKRLP